MDHQEEDEEGVSISEYIEGLKAQQLEADIVLGGDEGNECTYEKGYMTRQAVFSCLTCTPGGNAGFCTACCLQCHDGHVVVELWTRRAFRCDCGNEEFGTFQCKLFKDKEPRNETNVYNQNYVGLYCTCHRPFPDPDGLDQGEMLQCCVCEDWFHETHLGLSPTQQVPRDDDGEPVFDELICQSCANRCTFLAHYPDLLVSPMEFRDATGTLEDGNVDAGAVEIDGTEISQTPQDASNTDCPSSSLSNDQNSLNPTKINCETNLQNSTVEITHGTVGQSSRSGFSVCKLKRVCSARDDNEANGIVKNGVETHVPIFVHAIFMAKSWRSQLCQCEDCLAVYASYQVQFLLRNDDTLHVYEEIATKKRKECEERDEGSARDFMKKLGHVQKMELLYGIKDMTSELESFLKPFGEAGKTVTSADIYEFLESCERNEDAQTSEREMQQVGTVGVMLDESTQGASSFQLLGAYLWGP